MDRSKATVLVKVRFLDKDRRMLPDMSAKVSFLPRRLAPKEMKPRLAAGRSALIDRNSRTFAYLLKGNGSGRRRSGSGQRLVIWW